MLKSKISMRSYCRERRNVFALTRKQTRRVSRADVDAVAEPAAKVK